MGHGTFRFVLAFLDEQSPVAALERYVLSGPITSMSQSNLNMPVLMETIFFTLAGTCRVFLSLVWRDP
jgi:hypothetical protein